tara:strand:+ start:17786 stop:18034 length:249 start_codon:yes stop_codon:yes gene_type:complete
MKNKYQKIRKFTGWILIIVSIILSLIGFIYIVYGEFIVGGGIYFASQLTWYPGIALLGPEIIQKAKDIYQNTKTIVANYFRK